MDKDLIDRIEKIRVVSALKGFTIVAKGGYSEFDEALETLETVKEQRACPRYEWIGALLIHDAGITTSEMDQYYEYVDRQEELRLETEQAELEKQIPELNWLRETCNFREVISRRYPDHYHFKFDRVTEARRIPIRARLFYPSRGQFRIRYEWSDPATGGKEFFSFNGNRYTANRPRWFPDWWRVYKPEYLALAFAHMMNSRWIGPFNAVPKP